MTNAFQHRYSRESNDECAPTVGLAGGVRASDTDIEDVLLLYLAVTDTVKGAGHGFRDATADAKRKDFFARYLKRKK
jgi:hypothetical protein